MLLSAQHKDGQTSEGMPNSQSQQEGIEEPERDPQQEEQPDTKGGKDIADYDPDVDYEGSEPKVKQSAQEQKWKFPMVGPSAKG